MGDNNKQVKSTKNFDFSKSKEKRFDFTKDEKPIRKNNGLLWGFIALLVVAIALILFLKNASSKEDTPIVPTIEVVDSVLTTDSVTEIQDSIQQEESIVEETVVANTNGDSVQGQSASASVNMSTESVEQMAWSVIRGNYDNNPIRRQKLGEDYQVIQDKVNELYRKGLVH